MPTCSPNHFFIIIAAWLLDAFIGDPKHMPHPVRLIGTCISWMEKMAPQWFTHKKAAGVFIGVLVPATAYLCAAAIIKAAFSISPWFGVIASIVLIYYCLSTRCLADEACAIFKELGSGNLSAARQRLMWIVGRDTGSLDEKEIVRATVETVSENTVDGIISPLFFAVLGGAPLAMAFKAVSTLDSMIGYKNEDYRELGWFSARFDDWLNFIPARLCLVLVPAAALFWSPSGFLASLRIGLRDSRNSPSPNSGFPEACFAGALDVQLGGPCSYGGVVSNKQLIGDNKHELAADDIKKAVCLMWLVSGLSLVVFSALRIIVWGSL
jgi:adenosylcobinamide-phosphate synthase